MNVIDAYVTRVLGPPYKRWNKWWVQVECDSYGVISENTLMFNSEFEALQVKIGDLCLI
jgi:hypothetical protein